MKCPINKPKSKFSQGYYTQNTVVKSVMKINYLHLYSLVEILLLQKFHSFQAPWGMLNVMGHYIERD